MIKYKTKGINAFNPLRGLVRNKISRILKWRDLDLTQQDINLLTDEQTKKLCDLAEIKLK